MNNLPDNWISDVMEKRAEFESAPKPFPTPPLLDSIFYLVGEVAELGMELHAITRQGDLRNPGSKRNGISGELGDSLFMLGTVAHQVGHQELYTYNIFSGTKQSAIIHPSYRDLIDTCAVTQSLALELYDELDNDGLLPVLASATDILNDIYSNLETLSHWLDIDMTGALTSTYAKIAERSGL